MTEIRRWLYYNIVAHEDAENGYNFYIQHGYVMPYMPYVKNYHYINKSLLKFVPNEYKTSMSNYQLDKGNYSWISIGLV
jgi:hypothetical protein